jgi:serine/threonine protein kinase
VTDNYSLAPGTTIGEDFEIESALAVGAMGEVYRAFQRSTGMRRALKVMNPMLLTDRRARERFAEEARIGALIPSDHIVQVVAAGIDAPRGLPWIAMELLEGETLDSMIARRGALPLDEAADILLQVCHALSAAHDQGVIHCDLKPDNIFVSRTRSIIESRHVKVLDFGIARLIHDSRQSIELSRAIGSPFFMSPEQTKAGTSIRASADVWSLGLITFQMLSGKHYWKSANVPSDKVDIGTQIIEMKGGRIISASERAHHLGIPEILPIWFDAWFSRCVMRKADRRFPSAGDAAKAWTRALLESPESSGSAEDPRNERESANSERIVAGAGRTAGVRPRVSIAPTQPILATPSPPTSAPTQPIDAIVSTQPMVVTRSPPLLAPTQPMNVIARTQPMDTIASPQQMLVKPPPPPIASTQPMLVTPPPPPIASTQPMDAIVRTQPMVVNPHPLAMGPPQPTVPIARTPLIEAGPSGSPAPAGWPMVLGEFFEAKSEGWTLASSSRTPPLPLCFDARGLVITLPGGDTSVVAYRLDKLEFTDFSVSVTVALLSTKEPIQAFAGISFRAKSYSDNYLFVINGEGSYRLDRRVADTMSTLIDWTHHEALRTGVGGENRLHVVAIGGKITIFANGETLDSVTDDAFGVGHIALQAQGGSAENRSHTVFAFSNLKITTPLAHSTADAGKVTNSSANAKRSSRARDRTSVRVDSGGDRQLRNSNESTWKDWARAMIRGVDQEGVRLFWCNGAPQGLRRAGLA